MCENAKMVATDYEIFSEAIEPFCINLNPTVSLSVFSSVEETWAIFKKKIRHTVVYCSDQRMYIFKFSRFGGGCSVRCPLLDPSFNFAISSALMSWENIYVTIYAICQLIDTSSATACFRMANMRKQN